MARVKDDFGYRYNIPRVELNAIELVDNGAVPSKSIRNKKLRKKVAEAYARKLRLDIAYIARRSLKKKKLVMRKLRAKTLSKVDKKLDRLTWKRLSAIYRSLTKNARTQRRWYRVQNRTHKLRK